MDPNQQTQIRVWTGYRFLSWGYLPTPKGRTLGNYVLPGESPQPLIYNIFLTYGLNTTFMAKIILTWWIYKSQLQKPWSSFKAIFTLLTMKWHRWGQEVDHIRCCLSHDWIPAKATEDGKTYVQLFFSPFIKCLPLTLFLRRTVPEGCQKEIEGQRTAENLSPPRTGRRTPLYDFRAGDCFSMSQGHLH